MLVLGLTGPIASGKSTVSRMLGCRGAEIVDVDFIGHCVTATHVPSLERIKREFGPEYLRADGCLDRKKLGRLVFSDQALLKRLNAIVHPQIKRQVAATIAERRAGKDSPKVLVLDAALLEQIGLDEYVDMIWAVVADQQTQIERLFVRDGLSREDAIARIRSQTCLAGILERADAVIDNSGSLEDTKRQVNDLFERYIARSDR